MRYHPYPIYIYICGIKFFGCAVGLFFGRGDKSGYGFPKIIHHILVGASQAELFSNKCFFNTVQQYVKVMVLC